MSVATLQEVGQDLSQWVALVKRGESVVITERGKVVARLMPPEKTLTEKQPEPSHVAWPDFAARRRAVFGQTVLPAGFVQSLIDEDRGE